jgi:glycosyltransferase involved in cell wall biosynthesis
VKPLLFVTGHAPAYRVGALARLHEREGIELALFGGRYKHGGAGFDEQMPFPHRHVRPRELFALAGSGDYRAVVCPTGGRLAPLATWAGARRARVPLILWASLWAHPASAAHALSFLPLRRLYRSADAVVTYGPHVSSYVAARGARNVFVAAQSVDNEFWGAPAAAAASAWPAGADTRFLFVGRDAREKGVAVLIDAWRVAELPTPANALLLVGAGSGSAALAPAGSPRDGDAGSHTAAFAPAGLRREANAGIVSLDTVAPPRLREMYAAADVLVVPSIRTRTFREPWGLVVNEAMNRGLAVIASDAVGAAAGGLVRDGANGLVVPAGNSGALAAAVRRLAGDAALRAKLGEQAREDVRAYTHDAWAAGFSQALASVGLARGRW